MKQDSLNSFREKHPIITNSVLIVFAFIAAIYIGLLFIDVFTSHGQERLVPEVRNLPLEQAIEKLEDAGLSWDIADSTNFNESFKPGVIIDQEPKAGSYIKAIRTVYLSVNALHPRIVSMPQLQETSIRQGLAMLRSMGFKSIEVDSIASPYQGLIVQVSVNGKQVAPGTGVAINAKVKLSVGDGSIKSDNPYQAIDSALIDSIEAAQYELGY
ncbi:MAG: PASTA domain-containing protein [Bacteroidales bacterium]|nr:PASTA domain-containing protein [Candidatus Sodaliphilus fimicaballi]